MVQTGAVDDDQRAASPAGAWERIRGLTYRNELAVLAAVVVATPLVLRKQPTLGVYGLGLVGGASLALQAVGIVLVYRSNRFVNFAQVQIGVVAATLFTTLVHGQALIRGAQRLCPPCVGRVGAGARNVNYVAALALSLGFSVLLGWLVYVLVFKRFAEAPRLVLTVATIFLSQALGAVESAIPGLLATRHQRDLGVRGKAPLPVDFHFTLGHVRFDAVDLITLLAAAAVVGGLSTYFRRSATGTAIRASSDNPARAESLGVDVNAVTGRVWMIVGALSGIAAILTAITFGSGGQSGGTPVSLLVRIIAVAVVARFVSLPMAGAAALVIGLVDQAFFFSFNTGEVLDGVLLVIIAALLLVQRAGTSRADVETGGSWRATREIRPIPAELRDLAIVRSRLRWAAAAAAAVLIGLPWVLAPSQTGVGSVVLIDAIVGMSLLVLTGWAGQVSLGQFAFAAIGAYVAAVTHLPFLLALPVGAVAGALAAVAVGLPALKLRGLYLAITTLAFALATSAILLNPRYLGRHLPARLARPSLLGIDLADQRAFYYVSLIVLALVVLSVASMRRSRTARALIAARDNEAAAQSFGISLVGARLGAFAVSGFMAALAGALFAFEQGGVRPLAFSAEQSVRIFTFSVVGGLGSIAGPLIGFVWYGVLSLASASSLVVGLAGGAGGLLLLLFVPGGLSQIVFGVRDALLRRVARRLRIEVPSLTADRRTTAEGDRVPIAPRLGVAPSVRYDLDDQWDVPIGAGHG